MGFFDDIFGQPFGGMFDFNGDGKTDFGESWIGHMIINDCMKNEEDDSTYSDTSSFFGGTTDDNDWRLFCEDGSAYGVVPEYYDSQFDYEEALAEAKRKFAWRETCEDGFDYGIDPDDYDSAEEYEEALADAKNSVDEINIPVSLSFSFTYPGQEALEAIKSENYPNKRQYDAAYHLCDVEQGTAFISDDSSKEFEIKKCKFICQSISKTDLSIFQMQEIVENLYWMLSIVLRLSALHHVYITPKKLAEYQDLRLHNYLEIVSQYDVCDDSLWNNAIKIITSLECYGKDDRTEYLVELRKLATDNSKSSCFNIFEYYYAESIVCLCYNYACEMSIRNISKHYDSNELREKRSLAQSFKADFFLRLKQNWNGGKKADERYLTGESNLFVEFKDLKKIPDLNEAVRMIGYFKRSGLVHENDYNYKSIPSYEYGLKAQRKSRKITALLSIAQRIALCFMCVLIACTLELLMNMLQGLLESKIEVSSLVFSITQTLIFLFVAEAITSLLASRFKWLLSLSEAIGGIGTFISDMTHILITKANSHQNEIIVGEQMELYSAGQPIDFIRTKSLVRYRKLKLRDSLKDTFEPVNEYPIADISNEEVVKKILRSEELFNYKYGVVYNSDYNTMIVDPIENGENGFYPYERVIPTKGEGVVVVAVCEGKFILINQARHAIRKNQWCFVRGFGEDGLDPEKNAKKELAEEIDAQVIEDPILLGKVVSDSGLTGGAAKVYLIQVNDYSCNEKHEGVHSVQTYDENELSCMIQNGAIDDGFTLAAYLLYKVYQTKQ